jgi:hypothetical protein
MRLEDRGRVGSEQGCMSHGLFTPSVGGPISRASPSSCVEGRGQGLKGRFSVEGEKSRGRGWFAVEKKRGGKQGWCSGRRRGFSERVSRGRPVRGLRIPKEHGFTSFNAKGLSQWVVVVVVVVVCVWLAQGELESLTSRSRRVANRSLQAGRLSLALKGVSTRLSGEESRRERYTRTMCFGRRFCVSIGRNSAR